MFYRKPLTYEFDALEPYIDVRTMKEHYQVHYKKYTDLLNEAIIENNIPTIYNIEKVLQEYQAIKKIRNNGGGFYNHLLYFSMMSPHRRGFEASASPKLKQLFEETFGTYESFTNQFKQAGSDVFGSGWAWLIYSGEKLNIATTEKQDNPIMAMDCQILLGMDVWEHAYYLKHLADRKSYMDDFLEVVCWRSVSERLT